MKRFWSKSLLTVSIGLLAIGGTSVNAATNKDDSVKVILDNMTYASYQYQFVPNDATIGIKFSGEQEINVIDPDRIQIRKYPFTGAPVELEFEEEENVLLIKHEKDFEPNQSYQIFIDNGAIEDQHKNRLLSQTFYFITNRVSFRNVMFNNGSSNYMLDAYVPRQVRVYPNERYIESIEVTAMKEAMHSNGMISTVTNVDVVTTGDVVKRVDVELQSNQVQSEQARKFKTEKDKAYFDSGFKGVNFHQGAIDVKIRAYSDVAGTTLVDEKLILLLDDGKDYVSYKEEYEYETAGEKYSLYDLVSNDTLLQTMLNENKIDDIYFQLVESR